jgi:hypothetical protein
MSLLAELPLNSYLRQTDLSNLSVMEQYDYATARGMMWLS